MYFFALLLLPKLLYSLDLNLMCTNYNVNNKEVDVKDIFLLMDSDSKKIELGGLSFFADQIFITNSNISWTASDINLYPDSDGEDSNGEISGIIGRYSGELVLNFKKNHEKRGKSLIFNCRKFKMKERKF